MFQNFPRIFPLSYFAKFSISLQNLSISLQSCLHNLSISLKNQYFSSLFLPQNSHRIADRRRV
ncbi:hypothetical protein M6B38_177205 [Iris pallida]|uniref:Uncharacterized protein n=1 Tax=Iris pallida TaxID=29817 RepID=A0AAX6EPM8_IRIPA|nr:hypothetical protein M6B38_177205 [Iris pallida]